jgi:hypothetical protein
LPIVFLFSAMRVAMLLIVLLSASTIPASVAKPVLRFSPAQIRLGEWVTVTWEGIPDAALNLKTSEYICSQDSYCRRARIELPSTSAPVANFTIDCVPMPQRRAAVCVDWRLPRQR